LYVSARACLTFAAAFVLLTLLTGCVQRTISISSEPVGALVYLNDEEVGRTPLVVPFTFYGKYDVRLSKEGYRPLWTSGDAEAPWWEFPGPDLIAELTSQKVNINWHYQLQPRNDDDPTEVISNANELRDRTLGIKKKKKSTKPAPATTQPAFVPVAPVGGPTGAP
jgi:hypothetical protein